VKKDKRSEKFYFVGYAPNGYRLWNPEKRKIIISRDVKFEETSRKRNENVKTNKIKFFQQNENSLDTNEIENEED